ncbi:MAG: UDP-N-acetylmuramoyl-tripeptide--D-alanyl-D-alanine ligase [Hyphomicrobiaceae bacterium]|nr:UDP-N-acetylmuramoyl-tripeptide--D-alanyl-D-alanine ligase [Hyphomicrobiaceae bacterium]
MAEPLWTVPDLIAATSGRLDGEAPDGIVGISIDSRSLAPGDLFVALKDQRDGHEFVGAAFAAGAAAALVAEGYARQPGDGALVRVADTLEGLRGLARAARQRIVDMARDEMAPDPHVIAVTGSAGKTTTKEMLRTALSAYGPTHAADKSFNNHWGVPLTLARMPAGTKYAVIEIGMNHAGEIAPLSKLARPAVAIVLNVLPAHIGHFDSIEGIAREKASIFAGLADGGTAIYNATTSSSGILRAIAEKHARLVWSFGGRAAVGADACVKGNADNFGRPEAAIGFKAGDEETFPMPVHGMHIAENTAAIALAMRVCEIADFSPAKRALAEMSAPAGRGDRVEIAVPSGGTALLIDESYNANPGSMVAAINTARGEAEPELSRLVFVLGDMLELGERSTELHNELRDVIGHYPKTTVFAAGPHMSAMLDGLPEAMRGGQALTAAELQPMVLAALRDGDVVMVKGSNGSKVWQVAHALKALRKS